MIVLLILIVLLVVVASIQPQPTTVSSYELERRAKLKNHHMDLESLRGQLNHGVRVLQGIVVALLLLAIFLAALRTYHYAVAVIMTIVIIIFYQQLAVAPGLRQLTARLYRRYERAFLSAVLKLKVFLDPLSNKQQSSDNIIISTKGELEDIIARSAVISVSEKDLLANSMRFMDRKVENVMVPLNRLHTIPPTEILGPLVVDDLYHSGDSDFLVVDSKQHLLGTLSIDKLLSLEERRSLTARELMDRNVISVEKGALLASALRILLQERLRILVIIDEHKQPLGAVRLYDVLKFLFGSSLD